MMIKIKDNDLQQQGLSINCFHKVQHLLTKQQNSQFSTTLCIINFHISFIDEIKTNYHGVLGFWGFGVFSRLVNLALQNVNKE